MSHIMNFWKKKILHLNFGVLLLAAAIVINFYEFPKLEQSRSEGNWKALYRFSSADLIELGLQSKDRLQQRYNPAITLGIIAPGATIIMSDKEPLSGDELHAQLLSYGKVEKITTVSFDSQSIIGEFDPSLHIIQEGKEDFRYKPWAIAYNSDTPTEFILLEWNSTDKGEIDLLIETSLLPIETISELK